jgi:penicillin-binding protein 1B
MAVPAVSYDQTMIRKVIRRMPIPPRGKILRKLLFFSALFVLSAFAFYVYRLYSNAATVVENHLKSQRWALPSTIYADAPILYQGMPMKSARLVEYLERLDYQQRGAADVETGEYHNKNGRILFRKHSLFQGKEPEPLIAVTFGPTAVERIENVGEKEELPAYELEPIPISNLFGGEWEKRRLVKYSDLPEHLVQAVLAIEDRRFFHHGGIDLKAVVRAIWNDLTNENQLQGGSTITQQLVKNFYLSP